MGSEEREIQRGGRVTISKRLRDKYGLMEGTVVRFRDRGDRIEIEPPTLLTDLIGLVEDNSPSDDPKREAREYTWNRLLREVEVTPDSEFRINKIKVKLV